MTVSVLPMYHLFAMNVTMTPTLFQGGKFVIMPKFEPDTFANALSNHKVILIVEEESSFPVL